MRERLPCVYILASRQRGTLYVGVTSDLVQRIWQHKNDVAQGFTQKYGVHSLVWYELHGTMHSAITREKNLKTWQRSWKIQLIESTNAEWRDLISGYHLKPKPSQKWIPSFRWDDEQKMAIPDHFNAFRIHNDAAGYRSGIESVSLDNLAPGE